MLIVDGWLPKKYLCRLAVVESLASVYIATLIGTPITCTNKNSAPLQETPRLRKYARWRMGFLKSHHTNGVGDKNDVPLCLKIIRQIGTSGANRKNSAVACLMDGKLNHPSFPY